MMILNKKRLLWSAQLLSKVVGPFFLCVYVQKMKHKMWRASLIVNEMSKTFVLFRNLTPESCLEKPCHPRRHGFLRFRQSFDCLSTVYVGKICFDVTKRFIWAQIESYRELHENPMQFNPIRLIAQRLTGLSSNWLILHAKLKEKSDECINIL